MWQEAFSLLLVFSLLVTPVASQDVNETEDRTVVDTVLDLVSDFPDNIVIQSEKENVSSPEEQEPQGGSVLWVILLTLTLVAIVIYSFEIDPLKVIGAAALLALIGSLGVQGFIPI